MKSITSVVKIVWNKNDDPDIIHYEKDVGQRLGDDNINFKSKFNQFKTETNMLLTGFDASIEQVMYIDKKNDRSYITPIYI